MIQKVKETDRRKLAAAAIRAAEFSYSPYSGFRVGAALMTEEGRIFTGCNIENAAYTPTICAERTAIFKAASEGYRNFTAIAVTGGRSGIGLAAPCGVCRQVMMEFCGKEFEIILVTGEDCYEVHTLGGLLPMGFGPEDLERSPS